MKNKYPFIYQATVFWIEGDEACHYRIAGLGFCEDYVDAVAQIEKREGENLESIEHLEMIGQKGETLIEIPPNLVKLIIEHDPLKLTPYTKEV